MQSRFTPRSTVRAAILLAVAIAASTAIAAPTGATAQPKRAEKPLLLLTNADGIRSTGLRELARALRETADVIVAAPTGRRPGASQCLPPRDGFRLERVDDDVFAIDTTPAGCVAVAVQLISPDRPFDLVVSGIDPGLALGADVNVSGTFGAARMAADLGIPAIAISIAPGKGDLPAAISFSHELIKEALERKHPSTVVLNVNLPSGSFRQWRKPLLAPLGGRAFAIGFTATRGTADGARLSTDIRPFTGPVPSGCDTWAHRRGHVTVTPVPLLSAPPAELDLESWRIFDDKSADRYAPPESGESPRSPDAGGGDEKAPAPKSPPVPRKEA